MYLFQHVFHCSKHLWKSVFDVDRSFCVIFCFMISTSSNFLPYRLSFILGNTEESHTMQGGENIEIAALVRFWVWLRSVAWAEMIVLWWICQFPDDHIFVRLRCTASCRCRRIVYNIPYLLFNLLKWTHDAQHHLHWEKSVSSTFVLLQTWWSCFGHGNEGAFQTAVWAFVLESQL
jgi:hypothetical protein